MKTSACTQCGYPTRRPYTRCLHCRLPRVALALRVAKDLSGIIAVMLVIYALIVAFDYAHGVR